MIRSDHDSLRYWRTTEIEGMVGKWLARLSAFDFEIDHRSGKNHGNADADGLRRKEDTRPCHLPFCEECVDEWECSKGVKLGAVTLRSHSSTRQKNRRAKRKSAKLQS